ncbi:hypothetical protein [Kosakonia sacchari]
MSIFKNENEMQSWLEKEMEDIEGLGSLLFNVESIKNYKPRNEVEKKIKDSYMHCLPSLYLTEIITKNQNISSSSGDILKPDILAYGIERESLILIELKNLSGTTREAGTELAAYSGELKGYLSHLSDGDIMNVIISPFWPTLLKHYVFNNIVWQNKNMICLEPCIVENKIVLKPLELSILLQAEMPQKFGPEHLCGYHICLYDDSQYSHDREPTKLHGQIEVIKASIARMAAEGEKANSHGFLILTKEINGYGLAPYMITLVNAAPLSSIERYFHSDEIKTYKDLPFIGQKIYDIVTYYEPLGLGANTSKIFTSGKPYLKKICNPQIESINPWTILRGEINNWRTEAIYFESWGVFKEKSMEILFNKYQSDDYDYNLNSIQLGFEVIEELVDEQYEFKRLPALRKIEF